MLCIKKDVDGTKDWIWGALTEFRGGSIRELTKQETTGSPFLVWHRTRTKDLACLSFSATTIQLLSVFHLTPSTYCRGTQYRVFFDHTRYYTYSPSLLPLRLSLKSTKPLKVYRSETPLSLVSATLQNPRFWREGCIFIDEGLIES